MIVSQSLMYWKSQLHTSVYIKNQFWSLGWSNNIRFLAMSCTISSKSERPSLLSVQIVVLVVSRCILSVKHDLTRLTFFPFIKIAWQCQKPTVLIYTVCLLSTVFYCLLPILLTGVMPILLTGVMPILLTGVMPILLTGVMPILCTFPAADSFTEHATDHVYSACCQPCLQSNQIKSNHLLRSQQTITNIIKIIY